MKIYYIVKKGFASFYAIIMLLILSLMISIIHLQTQSKLLLLKKQKEHLIEIKAYQLVKEYGLQEFDIEFLGEKISSRVEEDKINLVFLGKEIEINYNDNYKQIELIEVKWVETVWKLV